MSDQPFHHGRLRAELLERAERVVREDGPDALSLRELARQAGVSHAAPRRHFADRKALLDAVAQHGFERLSDTLRAASEGAGASPAERFRAAATAYVDFAGSEARLHELMFAVKAADGPESLRRAADTFFATSNRLLAPERGPDVPWDDPKRLLVIATLRGIAALRASGRLEQRTVDDLLDEATRTFFRSPSA